MFCCQKYHLTADASCRAGNHDTFASQLFTYRFHVNDNLIARQQVLNADLLQLGLGLSVAAIPFLGLLRHVDVDACLDKVVL